MENIVDFISVPLINGFIETIIQEISVGETAVNENYGKDSRENICGRKDEQIIEG